MILLDTSVLIDPGAIALPDEALGFSALCYAELALGITIGVDREVRALRQFRLSQLQQTLAARWLPFDRRAADGYAAVAAIVHPHRPSHARSKDIMLAGHAFALGASLATLNPKDFELVAELVPIISPTSH
ncbi:hypothetical protein GCM10022288_23120 [Gryllotalpicola kribbensis]|uniref:PIN domain-containing protein n=1 Tax=Gryllotalpicola kribbensis TaxID=993084 RepID=A0ABP8AVY4_9MICO